MNNHNYTDQLEQTVRVVDQSCQRQGDVILVSPNLKDFGPVIVRHEVLDGAVLQIQGTTSASMRADRVNDNVAEIAQLNGDDGVDYSVNDDLLAVCTISEEIDAASFALQIHRLRKRLYRGINDWCKYCTPIKPGATVNVEPYYGVDHYNQAGIGLDQFDFLEIPHWSPVIEIDLIEFTGGPLVGTRAIAIDSSGANTVVSTIGYRLIEWNMSTFTHNPDPTEGFDVQSWLDANPYKVIQMTDEMVGVVGAAVAAISKEDNFSISRADHFDNE